MLWKQALVHIETLSRRFIYETRDKLKFHSHFVITAHDYGTKCEATAHSIQKFTILYHQIVCEKKHSIKWTEVRFHMSTCLKCILNNSLHWTLLIALLLLLFLLLLLQYLSPSLDKQHRHWDWWDSSVLAGKWQLCHMPASNDTTFL